MPGPDPGIQGEETRRCGKQGFTKIDAASRLLDCRIKSGNDMLVLRKTWGPDKPGHDAFSADTLNYVRSCSKARASQAFFRNSVLRTRPFTFSALHSM